MFIRINSADHTDVLIHPQRIAFVMEEKNGCRIHFDNNNWIKTTASFEDVVKGIEAVIANEKK